MRYRFLLLALALLPLSAYPKNLTERFGLGVTFHDFNSTTALSGRYYFTQPLAVSALLGFDSGSSAKALVIGAKLHRLLYLEDNLNFYIGAGVYLLSGLVGSSTATGFELDGLFGAEFFLSGLPNLGFQLEGGLAIRSVGATAIKSLGGVFGGAGVHYYF